MAVVPTQVPISTSVPALTLAAGSAGGVAVAASIDPINDYSLIYTASATATQGINRNTYLGLSSAPVGVNDTQTLANKTLTNPTINGATVSGTIGGTYTLGGTPTFPANVATATGTQTLTNKTLTSPTITSPTITNATISTDAINGYTTANTGTVYGLSVVNGQITTASLPNTISTAKLQNPYKFSAYLNSAQVLTTSGTFYTVQFNTKNFDSSNNYSTSTYAFTAPAPGYYFLESSVVLNNGSGTMYFNVQFLKNGSTVLKLVQGFTNGTYANTNSTINGFYQLATNDTVVVQVQVQTNGVGLNALGPSASSFDGYLVSTT